MTWWKRVTLTSMCGRCRNPIPVGAPAWHVQPAGLSHPKLRCQSCAGEPVPSEVPGVVEEPARRVSVTFGASVGELATDWKRAQAGDA